MILSSWSYSEPLIHSYLLPNACIIRDIISRDSVLFVQTSEGNPGVMTNEQRNEARQSLSEFNIQWLPLKHRRFGMRALFAYCGQLLMLVRFIRKQKIDVIHSFAPAAGTMALILKFLTGKKLVIDSWEPHAESMVETGVWKKNSFAFRILWWSEKMQARKADVLIAASPGMIEYARNAYGVEAKNVHVRPACVDMVLFNPNRFDHHAIRAKMNVETKIVCACVSKLGGLYLKQEVFELFKIGADVFGEKFHVLLLSPNSKGEVLGLCKDSGFLARQLTHVSVPHTLVPEYLSACDFAFNPQQPVPSKRFGTPVKDGEYWAMGLPIMILPEISEDSSIVLNENVGVILQNLEESAMRKSMSNMKSLLESKLVNKEHVRNIAKKYRSYEIAKKVYQEVYGNGSV